MLLSDEYVVILISSETFRDWGCELINDFHIYKICQTCFCF